MSGNPGDQHQWLPPLPPPPMPPPMPPGLHLNGAGGHNLPPGVQLNNSVEMNLIIKTEPGEYDYKNSLEGPLDGDQQSSHEEILTSEFGQSARDTAPTGRTILGTVCNNFENFEKILKFCRLKALGKLEGLMLTNPLFVVDC